MNKAIDILKQPRVVILNEIKDLTLEQLNEIPAGFSNNIIWNLGHMVATQQGLCYTRAGLERHVTEDFFNNYKSGSKPERFFGTDELEEIKSLMFSTLEQLEQDLTTDIFAAYPTFVTRYGVEISNINEVMKFLPFHEGLHIGYIMSLRKVVKK